MLSNALLISNNTMAVFFFIHLRLIFHRSVVLMPEVSLECHALFPLCFFDNKPFEVKYDENWLWTTLSQTLDKTGKSEIGLLLFACSWSPSFGRGVTSAVFQHDGNVEELSEALTIDVIAGRIGTRESLITRIGILSIPGALLEGMDNTMFSMSLHSIVWKANCSDKGYCLGTKLSSSRSNLKSFAIALILSTEVGPTETKKRLNSSATVLSSLLKVLFDDDFFGKQR